MDEFPVADFRCWICCQLVAVGQNEQRSPKMNSSVVFGVFAEGVIAAIPVR